MLEFPESKDQDGEISISIYELGYLLNLTSPNSELWKALRKLSQMCKLSLRILS